MAAQTPRPNSLQRSVRPIPGLRPTAGIGELALDGPHKTQARALDPPAGLGARRVLRGDLWFAYHGCHGEAGLVPVHRDHDAGLKGRHSPPDPRRRATQAAALVTLEEMLAP